MTCEAAAHFASSASESDQLIERYAVLAKGVPLYEEPLNLLRSEEGIRDPGSYFAALLAIAQGYTSTGRIAGRAQVNPSVAARMLERLRGLGYVELMQPIELKPARARAYWRITDPYFRFWFRYVFSNRSRLERGLVDVVAREIAADFPTLTGGVFEDCCRAWVGRRSSLAGESREVGAWWSRKGDAEVDVVALGKDEYILLGSCKWRKGEVGESVLDQLYVHRALLGPKAARARLALFARHGFSERVQERARLGDVLLVTAGEMFGGGCWVVGSLI
ncbi:MAG: ATP-binding protein [Candidatus Dormibacteraceae bacterium]